MNIDRLTKAISKASERETKIEGDIIYFKDSNGLWFAAMGLKTFSLRKAVDWGKKSEIWDRQKSGFKVDWNHNTPMKNMNLKRNIK